MLQLREPRSGLLVYDTRAVIPGDYLEKSFNGGCSQNTIQSRLDVLVESGRHEEHRLKLSAYLRHKGSADNK